MSKATLDNRRRNKDGEISAKHGNTLIRTLRKVYGQSFAAGYPDTEQLREVLLKLNETSLSELRRDHETGHLEHHQGLEVRPLGPAAVRLGAGATNQSQQLSCTVRTAWCGSDQLSDNASDDDSLFLFAGSQGRLPC